MLLRNDLFGGLYRSRVQQKQDVFSSIEEWVLQPMDDDTKIKNTRTSRNKWLSLMRLKMFGIHYPAMSTTNGEKDSLLGQTILPPELGQFFGGLVFWGHPLTENLW